ncbi:hypothetical protein FEFB_15140 [Fructobacillus sp. EFB-N1]|nr:hypothetical protein FEFB_15140 [Fructobacillus sp. EFB-N1]
MKKEDEQFPRVPDWVAPLSASVGFMIGTLVVLIAMLLIK